jgi:hypothetical protein
LILITQILNIYIRTLDFLGVVEALVSAEKSANKQKSEFLATMSHGRGKK